jgi:hypothetical protein
LVECINKSLIELEERRREIGAESTAVESKLKAIRAREERLGMAFADGAVSESAYRLKLKRLQKEEAVLLKCQRNIDPTELGEMVSLGISIDMVKDVLNKGSRKISDYDILSQIDDIFNNLDFNVSTEHDGRENIHGYETTDSVMRATDKPPDFREGDDLQEEREATRKNQRALLQKFSIKVIVYPERVEIKGAIPTQILDKTDKEKTARIITSLSPS